MITSLTSPGAGGQPVHARWPAHRQIDSDFEVLAESTLSMMHVHVDGQPTIEQLASTLHEFGAQSQAMSRPMLLIDMTQVRSRFAREDYVRIISAMTSSFEHLQRTALLVSSDRSTATAERTARRQGIEMRVFHDERAALGWLGIPQK